MEEETAEHHDLYCYESKQYRIESKGTKTAVLMEVQTYVF